MIDFRSLHVGKAVLARDAFDSDDDYRVVEVHSDEFYVIGGMKRRGPYHNRRDAQYVADKSVTGSLR